MSLEAILALDLSELPIYNSGMRTIPLIPDGEALIDDNLYDWAIRYKWHLRDDGYAGRNAGHDMILMHRLIAMAAPNEQVHHQNENRLDNQRANLILMSLKEHNRFHWMARGPRSGKYRGVFKPANSHSWTAQIKVGSEMINLGRFVTEEEAASAWNDAARKYWGENVYQNPVQVPYKRLTRSDSSRLRKKRYRGIYFESYSGKWKSQITIPEEGRKNLGRFNSEKEAAKAYNDALDFYGLKDFPRNEI